MKRVFLYVRVSTEEQAIHGLSIDAQTAALREWAAANGHKVVGVYTDAGISARKPASKRPELQRLLKDVQGGKGDLVVFTKLDRWFRNIAEYYKVQEVLEKCRVDWRTIHEDYDTSTASGRLKINIMLSVAQDEADRTSERIKSVFEMKRQKLEPVSGRLPLGYVIEDKRIVKDPETEDMVNDIFQKFMSCGSMSETQRFILEKYNFRILYQRLSKMLYNTAYYGKMQGAEGMAPAYITKEQFDKVQELRVHYVRKTKKNRVYLFSGIAFCGECGRRMNVTPARGNASPIVKCCGHHAQLSGCGNKTCISEKKVEAFLMGAVEPKLSEYIIMVEEAEAANEKKSYKSEISAIRAKIARVKDLYINDIITLEECKEQNDTLNAALNALLEKEKPTKKLDISKLERLLTDGWKEDYADIGMSEKRDFWRLLIKAIRIYPDRHIEIDFNA